MTPAPDPSPSWRLFLGCWPDAHTHAALLARAADWSWSAGARRTRPERIHLTLHFIGDVPIARIPELVGGLRVGAPSGTLLLDRPAVWRGGIAVLEAGEVPAALRRLHDQLGAALQTLSLPVEERPWRPHVTFARQAQGSRPPADAPPIRWPLAAEYALVRSLPGGRGYETVQRFS